MSIKHNIVANYIGQIYAMLIGILLVPLYIKYMGVEAYGLIGFYVVLQVWFQLLDLGLTPTIAREVARFRGGAIDALSLKSLFQVLVVLFFVAALLGAAVLMISADYISSSWLHAQRLPRDEVRHSIMLMAVIISLRWIGGLYRGAINGFEQLVWLNGFNIIVATARFGLVIPLLIYVGTATTKFFSLQLVIALIEVVTLIVKTYRLMPKVVTRKRQNWEWGQLSIVLKFSLTVAFTNLLWAFVMQSDKLVLSRSLILSDYGYFMIAVQMASGVLVLSTPIIGAVQPRMTKMTAEGNESGFISLYRKATQLITVITISSSLLIGFFSEQVLWAWTGDRQIAQRVAPVAMLYALGNGIAAIRNLCVALQIAKGDLKLYMFESVIFITVFLPSLQWLAAKYGLIGAGYAWLGAQAIFFSFWIPLVHRRFIKGFHVSWLVQDFGALLSWSLFIVVIEYVLVNNITGWPVERLPVALIVALLGITAVTITAMGSKIIREAFGRQMGSFF